MRKVVKIVLESVVLLSLTTLIFDGTSLGIGQHSKAIFLHGTVGLGWLHADGRWIKDETGISIWLVGVGRSETSWAWSDAYAGYYRHHELERTYAQLKDYGMRIVRLGLNELHWRENRTLQDIDGVSTSYQTLVDNVVQWCYKAGIYVLLEWFTGVDHNLESQAYKATAIYDNPSSWLDFLKTIAQRYNNYPNVLMKPCNEPPNYSAWNLADGGNHSKDECILIYRQKVSQAIEAMRSVNPNLLIFVEPTTNTWSPVSEFGQSAPYGGHLPYANIVYTCHTYYSSDTDFPPSNNYAQFYANGNFTDGKTIFEKQLKNKMLNLLGENVPVFVDETAVWYEEGKYPNSLVVIQDFYSIMSKYQTGFVQWAWDGYWNQDQYPIDYHMLTFDWKTLSPIGETFTNWVAANIH